jgi:hypothetical protein
VRFLSYSAGCRTCKDCLRKESDGRSRPFAKKPEPDDLIEEYFDVGLLSPSAKAIRDSYEQQREEARLRRSGRYRQLRFEAD